MRYAIVFPSATNPPLAGKVLLVTKDRPAWQRGRLNLVGGHIEDGETPEEAAVRELKEESGLLPSVPPRPKTVGRLICQDSIVYCVNVPILSGQTISQGEGETEPVSWYNWNQVQYDERLLTNLQTVVPMMSMGVTGWTIKQATGDSSSFTIEFA